MPSRWAKERAAKMFGSATCGPSSDEVHALLKHAMNPDAVCRQLWQVKSEPGELCSAFRGVDGQVYNCHTPTSPSRVFHDFKMHPEFTLPASRGAPPWHLWRFDHHPITSRPRSDQEHFARRPLADRNA